jgi:hypothetical protein
MQQVGEAVGIKQVLRIIGTAYAAGPHHQSSASANPQTALSMQQQTSNGKDCNERNP